MGEFSTVMQTLDLSQNLPTPLVFTSGYANTENVFYCFNKNEKHLLLKCKLQKDDGEPFHRRRRTRNIRGNILLVTIYQKNT